MVEVGTLPSHQLLLRAATLPLTAAQPSPKPADVKTFQLRKARGKNESKEKGFVVPTVMIASLLLVYTLPVVLPVQQTNRSMQSVQHLTEYK